MKKLISVAVLGLVAVAAMAQVTKENVEKDLYITAAIHHPYIAPETIQDTKAPKGYKPFYVTHYGRHGSRYQTSAHPYKDNVPYLLEMADKGLLTEAGLKLKDEMVWLKKEHDGREGTLTARGCFEQRGVAERLYDRCPEIFNQKDRRVVTNRSTNVHRVIQSMGSFNMGLLSRQPKLVSSILTGDRYWDILCHSCDARKNPNMRRAWMVVDSLCKDTYTRLHPETLFTDIPAVEAICKTSAAEFEYSLFKATQITHTMDDIEGHDPLSIFDIDDLVEMGRLYNDEVMTWFTHTIETGPYNDTIIGRPIVRDVIATADAAIAGNDHCADFRFGHDSGVAPTLGLLGIGDYGKNIHIWEAADEWPGYKNLCMCSNIQFIFYRNRKGDVLMKMLRNEQEVEIPTLTPVSGPYYRWADVRAYFESKLQ